MTLAATAETTEAQDDVALRVVKAKTSFAAGMAALPAPRRDAMYALYAFCREVDDIADDGPTELARRAGLATWRQRITTLFTEGKADHAISRALLPTIPAFNLVAQDFLDIIDGMEMDAGAPSSRLNWRRSIFIVIGWPVRLGALRCVFLATPARQRCTSRIIWGAPCN